MSKPAYPEQHGDNRRGLNRRQVIRGVGVGLGGAALVPAGRHLLAQDSATPGASPSPSPVASPSASPVATPIPPVIPETSLTIVRDQRPEYGGTPSKGGDLRMYVRQDDLLDFSPTAQKQDIQILVSLYDPLVWIDEATMEPKPWLAESWSWSDDGLSLTFKLRKGVTFHDGDPLTAEHVAFSFLAYRDDYDSVMANFFALVTDVHAPDGQTVEVVFAEPDGAFLYNAASQPVFSAAQYQSHWESKPEGERTLSDYPWDNNPPLGTGPWKFADADDGSITLVRNDGYWQDAPFFDRLVLTGENDREKQIEGWKKGDADIVSPIRATDMHDLWSEDGKLYVAQAPVAFFSAFNFVNPANATQDMMKDPALREALTLAIDRTRYARDVFFEFIDETKAGTIVQPWAHDDAIANPEQDIERANKLLDNAGWVDSDGDGMREHPSGDVLDLYCIVNNTERPELLALLGMLGEDFAKIGARLTVQEIEPDEFDTRWVENRMYDMVAYSLVGYPAFAEYDLYGTAWDIRTNTVGWNPGGYSNPDVDQAIDEYFASWTQKDMRKALVSLQKAANDDLFGLWFGFPSDLVLVKPDIQGFLPDMYFQTWNTRLLWRGETVAPEASPVPATPIASPAASSVATPIGTPGATPVK
ncbi:MAG TPA: ABC transporter substrate-binding protein [Thermomicrobiales bacterium]|nr:ABC transporter substrate-binding protein [Thermomicrobiales bacterium]